MFEQQRSDESYEHAESFPVLPPIAEMEDLASVHQFRHRTNGFFNRNPGVDAMQII